MDQTDTSKGLAEEAKFTDHERKVLALEALSKLAEQFARDPDLQKLVDSLALTIAGQFGVSSTFVATRTFNSEILPPIKAATGKFRNISSDRELFNLMLSISNLTPDTEPTLLEDRMFPLGEDSAALADLRRLDVHLFIPMIIDRNIIGLILLGPRIRNLTFGESELELLKTLVATITPLIANSLLYAEMSQLKARYLRIMDSVPQAMFVFDSQWILRTANKIALDFLASLGGAMCEKSPVGLSMETVFPDSVFPDWTERLRSIGREMEDKLNSTIIMKQNDGERIFSVRASSLVSQPGADCERILTLQDITDQKENERRMFELEKFAEQGMMASSISHELNNYLGIIMGGTELVLANLDRGKPEKVISTLGKLKESITAMQRFTSGLMDFARVNVQKQPGNINEVATDVLSFAMAQKRFGRISVKTRLVPHLPAIEMDRDQIALVIINILNNAADAIAETGRSDGIIIVTTSNEAGFAGLSISDNGRGMKPEVRDKLFKTHLTTKPKGHGYGLMNCGKIIENHGASVEIKSQIGFGTTFDLRFPADPASEK